MTSKPRRIYWDSCVYIDFLQQDPDRYDTLREIIQEAKDGTVVLVASAMVLAEVTKLTDSPKPIEDQAAIIQEFFEHKFIQPRNVDRGIAEKAADLCRTHGLKPPDAIHVITALRCGCECLQTYDGKARGGAHKSGKKLLSFDGKIGSPPLRIEEPRTIGGDQQKLFV